MTTEPDFISAGVNLTLVDTVAEAVADADALPLAGEESGFVTGQNFVADGGMTRKMIYAD